MPRIDPFQLLKCLSVLLGPTGGIKSKEEVHRLANLMTKFSKKLVSKCIYIQILKTTDTELLSQFMDAGGWSLIHMWLTDGIVAKNWALIQELLELLLLCPVKIERLKSNNCPKLIKGLSKEVSHQIVRILAGHLVEQWLKIVKGEAAPNSVPAQIIGNLPSEITVNSMGQLEHQFTIASVATSGNELPLKNIVGEKSGVSSLEVAKTDEKIVNNAATISETEKITNSQIIDETSTKISQIKQSSGASIHPQSEKSHQVPVCKITIRDGNQVLAKVETEASNINNALKINASHEMNGGDSTVVSSVDYEESGEKDNDEGAVDNEISSEVKNKTTSISKKDNELTANTAKSKEDNNVKDNSIVISDNSNKSSDKENRDSHKTEDNKKGLSSGSCNNSSIGVSSDKKTSGSSNNNNSHGSSSSSSSRSGSGNSSSKHSSSSHRTGSSSHKSSSSSSHRSSSSSSRSSKDKSSRDKDRHSSSSSKHSSSSSSSRSKSDRDKERDKEKEKLKKDQAEKDKATLEKVQAQAISSKLGKIPRKKAEDEKINSSDSILRKSSTDSRDSSKENKEKIEAKKVSGSTGSSANAAAPAPPPILEKKQISISIENRKNSQDSARPKTVKTFNSKFRSTGLEEEVKPPLPRSANAKKPVALSNIEKKVIPTKPIASLKRTSPIRETSATSDKRAKLSLEPPVTSPIDEKKGGIKLIPPKPKPMVLQESDMFMDALTASTKGKEPRKRKRRTSISKDSSSSDAKKSEKCDSEGGHDSPQHPLSPQSADERSPLTVKPNFKFYQDTLETDEDKEEKLDEQSRVKKEEESADRVKAEADDNDDDEMSITNVVKNEIAAKIAKNEAKLAEDEAEMGSKSEVQSPDAEETNSEASDFAKNGASSLSPLPEIRYVDGLRSVLHLQKRKGPKKNLKWKTELESIRYFELDETERVNVTKTFTDMKQMEKQNEREAFQMARKLSTDDVMEEKTRWKALIPIDLLPALVEPGKDSREKDIQYAREKGILQALYFNRSMIPDSPAEPDEERHHAIIDPKIIPLEDLTGNKESEKDFTGVPWPEPKPHLTPPQPPVMQPTGYHFPAGFPHSAPPMMPPMGPPPGPMGGGPPGPMQMGPPGPMNQMVPPGPMNQMGGPDMGGPMSGPPPSGGGGGGGGWRTGDGKVVVPDVGMNPMQQQQQQQMPPNMPQGFPPGMDGPPMVPPGMMGPPMFNQQDNFGMMGPPDDMGFGNYQGPPGPGMFGPGPNFPGGPPRGGGPMHGNRGRGNGPGWFRGGGPGGGPPMRGGGGWRGGWRGNGKQPPICRQFTKNGFCRVGDKCQYLHPGVNCPPF